MGVTAGQINNPDRYKRWVYTEWFPWSSPGRTPTYVKMFVPVTQRINDGNVQSTVCQLQVVNDRYAVAILPLCVFFSNLTLLTYCWCDVSSSYSYVRKNTPNSHWILVSVFTESSVVQSIQSVSCMCVFPDDNFQTKRFSCRDLQRWFILVLTYVNFVR